MNILRFALATTLLALATTGARAAPPTCTLDPALVRSWGDYHRLQELRRDSYAVEYRACGKRLIYVAARHSNDPHSSAFRSVRAAFARRTPAIVVLEGFPEAFGFSPSSLTEHSNSVAGKPGDAEPYLSVRMANEAGAIFTGAEPTDAEVLIAVKPQGVTTADLFGFYVLRQIEQWQREQRITGPSDPALDGHIKRFASSFATDTGASAEALSRVNTLAGFKSWYEVTNGAPYDKAYRPDDAYPSNDKPRATNLISDKVGDARDRHIIAVIARALQKHRDVIVVYGGSHHLMQSPALEAAYGPPDFFAEP